MGFETYLDTLLQTLCGIQKKHPFTHDTIKDVDLTVRKLQKAWDVNVIFFGKTELANKLSKLSLMLGEHKAQNAKQCILTAIHELRRVE